MLTSPHPPGSNAEWFDTALLQQIIETEIDIAIHAAWRERGIRIDDTVRHVWSEDVRAGLIEKIKTRSLLPEDIDGAIGQHIHQLIEEYPEQKIVQDCGSMVVPMHGLFPLRRHALVLCRKFFEKRLE